MARRAWAMPAGAWPVASTTTSTSPDAIIAIASSVKRVAAMRASSQPTRRQAARARSGARSAIAVTSIPGVVGTCARNIEPNFPAPISPTRTGRRRQALLQQPMQVHAWSPFHAGRFHADIAPAGDARRMPEVEWRRLRADQLREQAQRDAIVILPVAALEQHGPHLPVEVDLILGETVALRTARKAVAERGRRAGAAGAMDRAIGTSHELRRHRHVGFRGVQRTGRGRGAFGAAARISADRSVECAWRQRERAAHHHRRTDTETRRADRAVHLLVRRGGGDREDPGNAGRPAACMRGGDLDDDGGAAGAGGDRSHPVGEVQYHAGRQRRCGRRRVSLAHHRQPFRLRRDRQSRSGQRGKGRTVVRGDLRRCWRRNYATRSCGNCPGSRSR